MEARTIRAGEWRELRSFRLRALADSPDAFGSTLESEARDADENWRRLARMGALAHASVIFVVEDESERDWIGMAWGQRQVDERPWEGHLFAMWVDPRRRRAGVGRALVEAVASWARERGADRIVLRVTSSNDAARRLYERSGFRATGDVEPLRDGSEMMTIVMERSLPSG